MSIEIRQVSKAFGSFQALHSINLTIEKGEFVAILGPSGCGKTTLLRILAGFEQPSGGEVQMDGRIVAGADRLLPRKNAELAWYFNPSLSGRI